MSTLEDDIVPFVDGNGYVAPNLVPPGQMRGSDNGTCYSSEYAILIKKNYPDDEHTTFYTAKGWEALIRMCMPQPGLTVRAPGDRAVDAPDNLYGILAASKVLNRPSVAQDVLSYGWKHLGFYDPTGTSGIKVEAFQWRQLQLVFAMYCASGYYKSWKFWLWPLAIYSSLSIAVSCWHTLASDTDSRRLAWLLIQTVKEDSLLCKLASKLWMSRLFKDYPNGMKDVYSIYYKDNHPFIKYAVNE